MKSVAWFAFLTVLLFPHATVSGQSANQPTQSPTQTEISPFLRSLDNGVWWNALPQNRKVDFVDGYVAAMANVRHELLAFYKQDVNQLVPGDPQFKARTDALGELAFLAELYDYDVDQTKLVAGVDEFYRDGRNTRIVTHLVLEYVRDTLNGKKAPRDLEKQLDEWRAIVNK